MEENRRKDSLVRVGDNSIVRYSNALVRRALEDVTKVDCSIKEVKIGEQIWMSENLNVDHFGNGDSIPEVNDPDEWAKLTTGAWCYYENDPENGKKYGKLYNWYAVNDPRGIAPEGWHIPTDEEFYELFEAVDFDCNALKAVRQGIGDGSETNTSGFSALLSGFRDSNGYFYYLGQNTYLWSFPDLYVVDFLDSSDIYSYRSFSINDSELYGGYDGDKKDGFSVRCVKDEHYILLDKDGKELLSDEEIIKNAHILVVDDEETIVQLVRAELIKEGFKNVHVAYDGKEALEVLERFGEEILVVTLGLIMPKVDGFEVMSSLAEKHQHIVGVIMVTGFRDLNTQKEFKRLGTEKIIAYDYINKPVDWEYLYTRIKEAITLVQSKREQINELSNN